MITRPDRKRVGGEQRRSHAGLPITPAISDEQIAIFSPGTRNGIMQRLTYSRTFDTRQPLSHIEIRRTVSSTEFNKVARSQCLPDRQQCSIDTDANERRVATFDAA